MVAFVAQQEGWTRVGEKETQLVDVEKLEAVAVGARIPRGRIRRSWKVCCDHFGVETAAEMSTMSPEVKTGTQKKAASPHASEQSGARG